MTAQIYKMYEEVPALHPKQMDLYLCKQGKGGLVSLRALLGYFKYYTTVEPNSADRAVIRESLAERLNISPERLLEEDCYGN